MVVVLEEHAKNRESRTEHQPVSIEIPRRAEYVGLCRLLAGVVSSGGPMSAEDVADLKLAVTEACTRFLWGGEDNISADLSDRSEESSEALRVEFRVEPESWEVVVSDPEHHHRIPGETQDAGSGSGDLGLTIMRALADEVEHSYSEAEGSVIRMTKRFAGPADNLE